MTSTYTAVNEVMTTLRDDLIAAKAMIDTPEKLSDSSAADALDIVCGVTGERRRTASVALAAVSTWNDFDSHQNLMALFDRAIASAESSS